MCVKTSSEEHPVHSQSWNKIVSSDKTKYLPRYVWRKKGCAYNSRSTIPTTKHGGGSIMICGCCSAKGVLHVIKGNRNEAVYHMICCKDLISSAKKLNQGEVESFKKTKHKSYSQSNDLHDLANLLNLWKFMKDFEIASLAISHFLPISIYFLIYLCFG